MKTLPILKISIVVAILVIIVAGVAVAAPLTGLFTGGGNWQWVSPAVQGNTIHALTFPVDPNTGWAVGIGGTVLKTVNGGDAWTVQTPSTQCGASPGAGCSLFEADFVDNNNGWVVGDYGTIWHTTNGGSNWTAQALPAPYTNATALQGVDFFDATHGVAVGSGYAFYTSNGGTTWTLASGVNSSHYLSAVQMVSATDAWAVGNGGTIYKTVNSGVSWASQPSPTGDNLKGVYFSDATHGLAVGGDANGRLLRYNGVSWEANTGVAPISTPLWSVTNAAGTLVAAGQGGAILTYTGTDIWTDAIDTVASGLSAASSGTSSLLIDVVAAPGGIVVYASGEAGAITRSGNSGGAWVMKAGGDSKNFTASSFINASEGWAAGANGEVIHTIDGGGSWSSDKTGIPADMDVRGIQFLNATTGFAVGCQGAGCPTTGTAVAYKYNSGTWSSMSGVPGGVTSLASVHMNSSTDGWAVGTGGTTLHTTNGSTWTPVAGVPANIEMNSVDAVGSSVWAVGQVSGGGGVILKYNGSGWSAPISPPSAPSFLTSIDMVDANTGFAAGSSGKMYKTTTGGGSSGAWSLQTTGTVKLLGSVAFLDANLGFASGEDGRVIKTMNGGSTWSIESKVGTNISMNTLTLARTASDYVGYIGGANAAVLKYARPAHSSYYWTWYDYLSPNASNTVLVANPKGAAGNVQVDLFVERSDKTLYDGGVIAPGTLTGYEYPGLMGGPVDLGSQTANKPVATQRVFWGNSLEEIEAMSEARLSDHFYWTWYDMQAPGFENWVLVANPNDFAVDYEIRIGGQVYTGGSGSLQPGQRVVPTFGGTRGGPVEVEAWQAGSNPHVPANVMASQRVLTNYRDAFNEEPGIPAGELSNDYVWTWYDQKNGAQDWILVANPGGGDAQIYYKVTIAGVLQDGSAFHPGETCKGPIADNTNEYPQFDGLQDGPVRVQTYSDSSCTIPANAIASQRSLFGPSFEEVPGFPNANLTDTYHWPLYDQASPGMMDWVLVGNPNNFPVYYEITLGNGAPVAAEVLPAGGRAYPTFTGQRTGPVKVTAVRDDNHAVPADVMASQRVLTNGYFNELFGIVLN